MLLLNCLSLYILHLRNILDRLLYLVYQLLILKGTYPSYVVLSKNSANMACTKAVSVLFATPLFKHLCSSELIDEYRAPQACARCVSRSAISPDQHHWISPWHFGPRPARLCLGRNARTALLISSASCPLPSSRVKSLMLVSAIDSSV